MLVRELIASVLAESLGADQAEEKDAINLLAAFERAANEINSCVGRLGPGVEARIDVSDIFNGIAEVPRNQIGVWLDILSAVAFTESGMYNLDIVNYLSITGSSRDKIALFPGSVSVFFSDFSAPVVDVYVRMLPAHIYVRYDDEVSSILPDYLSSIIRRSLLAYISIVDRGNPEFFYDKSIVSREDLWAAKRYLESIRKNVSTDRRPYIGR